MFEIIKEHLDEYIAYWKIMGEALLHPIDEISYRARHDTGFRKAATFLLFTVLTTTLFVTLAWGGNISDISGFVVNIIGTSALTLLGYVNFAIAWKIFRYKGDLILLAKVGMYFDALIIFLLTIVGILQHGYLKTFAAEKHIEYTKVLQTCGLDFFEKQAQLNAITENSTKIQNADTATGAAILLILIVYLSASLRLYFRLHPMSKLKRTGITLLAVLLSCITTPLGWWFIISLNAC
jgi:hypothetical protein